MTYEKLYTLTTHSKSLGITFTPRTPPHESFNLKLPKDSTTYIYRLKDESIIANTSGVKPEGADKLFGIKTGNAGILEVQDFQTSPIEKEP